VGKRERDYRNYGRKEGMDDWQEGSEKISGLRAVG